MMRMNSSRCSKLAAIIVVLVVFSGLSSAATVIGDEAPTNAQTGDKITGSFTFSDLYQNPSLEQWTLEGETELENVTWTVTTINQAGSQIEQTSYDGQSFSHPINIENDIAEVEVRLTGGVPQIANWSYDPPQSFVLAGFSQVREGGTSSELQSYETHHYTPASRSAREAIDAANRAIEEAGGNEQAETRVDNAVSAYEAANFDNAQSLAEQAEQTAQSAQQTQQRNQTILYVVVGVVVIIAVVGGLFWYRSRQTSRKL